MTGLSPLQAQYSRKFGAGYYRQPGDLRAAVRRARDRRFVGVTLVAICVLHGATFIALKTSGEVRAGAGWLARRVAPVTALFVLGVAAWLVYEHQEGWAFAATTITMAACVLSIFTDLYPRSWSRARARRSPDRTHPASCAPLPELDLLCVPAAHQ